MSDAISKKGLDEVYSTYKNCLKRPISNMMNKLFLEGKMSDDVVVPSTENIIDLRSKWIKCSDRLPEDDNDVLVYNYKDGISLGEFDSDSVRGYFEEDGAYFITNSGWETQYSWSPHMNPTHWMPLPSEPKD